RAGEAGQHRDQLMRGRGTSGAAPPQIRTILALAATLCVGGCGYSLQGNLPDHIKSVAVPVFRNRTTEPGVESTISSAVVNAFTTNGKLRVVSLDAADSMLEGEIIGFEVQSLAFDSRLNLRSYRLAVTMNVRFRDLKKSAMLWEQQGLREVVDFQVAGEVLEAREAGAEGIVRAAQTFPWGAARRVVIARGLEALGPKQAEPLVEYLVQPNPTTALLLAVPQVLASSHWLLKAVSAASVVDVPRLSGRSLIGWLRAHAASEGLELAEDAAQLLVTLVGEEPAALAAELGKAAL